MSDRLRASAAAPMELTFRHTTPAVEARVREWFSDRSSPHTLDGDRSVRLPHPENPSLELKIKGAGFRGGEIRFGKPLRSKLRAPVFDFDGRMMEDVASGHDNAWLGGASFQQVTVEHRMSALLAGLGKSVVPCVGYARIETDAGSSWCCFFDWDPRLVRICPPAVPVDEYAESKIRMGRELIELAVDHDLMGYTTYSAIGDRYFFTDLHPFRTFDPLNMSQLSWVMQAIFNLHIMCLATLHFLKVAGVTSFPRDVQAYSFRSLVPGATREDHESMRWTIVAPYMLRPPKRFSSRALYAALEANRLSRALLERCPERFERP